MREETLKSLVHLTDKLDERNLQEKLVRCITGLQADGEASIRTNAVIFLGRMAGRLKEGVRLRVLSVSFVKAMKDPFLHCRLAGLRASLACLTLLDGPQIAGKLLPQVCLLTLDRVAESRELALTVLEQSTAQLRRISEDLKRTEAEQKRLGIESGSANKPAESDTSWSIMGLSWGAAAVDGLAKTIEKTVLQNPGGDDGPKQNSTQSSNSNNHQTVSPKEMASKMKSQTATAVVSQKSATIGRDTWDEDIDIPDEGDVDNDDYSDNNESSAAIQRAGATVKSHKNNVVVAAAGGGWDDFDDDFDDDKFEDKPAKQIVPVVPKSLTSTNSNDPVSPTTTTISRAANNIDKVESSPVAKGIASAPAAKSKTTSSAKKPVVKLAKSKDENWDDF